MSIGQHDYPFPFPIDWDGVRFVLDRTPWEPADPTRGLPRRRKVPLFSDRNLEASYGRHNYAIAHFLHLRALQVQMCEEAKERGLTVITDRFATPQVWCALEVAPDRG